MTPPHIGQVALSVANLEHSITFYTQTIGMSLVNRDGIQACLGVGPNVLLVLLEEPGAIHIQRATGLYHLALLLPTRRDLAVTLKHLLDVNAPISGYADHAVSEAIYLTDPDGHGIEIYRDRPQSEWQYPGGRLHITVEPIDFQGIMAELDNNSPRWEGLAPGTIIGHIHLQVSNITASEEFYIHLMDVDLVTRYGAGASFLSANGYHHHFGLNIWAGAGLRPAPAGAARLLWYEWVTADTAAVQSIAAKLTIAGHPFESAEGGLTTTDPSGIQILITHRTPNNA